MYTLKDCYERYMNKVNMAHNYIKEWGIDNYAKAYVR